MLKEYEDKINEVTKEIKENQKKPTVVLKN